MIRHALEQGMREMGMTVSEQDIRAFELFAAELKKWNRRINLTAITADDEIAVKHIIDSLVLAGYVNDGENVLDIGSGAGVPSIPLKIVRPLVRVTSVDAIGKKILFQRHVARLLGLCGFEALHARVESLRKTHARSFDVITSRAFSRLEQFVALASPLLAEGGRMIAMKGPAAREGMEESGECLRSLGFEVSAVHAYRLPLNRGERNLIIIRPREST